MVVSTSNRDKFPFTRVGLLIVSLIIEGALLYGLTMGWLVFFPPHSTQVGFYAWTIPVDNYAYLIISQLEIQVILTIQSASHKMNGSDDISWKGIFK